MFAGSAEAKPIARTDTLQVHRAGLIRTGLLENMAKLGRGDVVSFQLVRSGELDLHGPYGIP